MSIKLGTKNKECLLFQFYEIDSDYLSSLYSKKVSTEIRKSQSIEIKKGQGSSLSEHAQAVGHLCPKLGETMPKPWGDDAQGLGKPCSFVYLWINSM